MIPELEGKYRDEVLRLIGWSEPKPSRILVVTGDNAAGKSFCRRLYQTECRQQKIECIALSIELQTSGMMGGMTAFVFGDEQTEATGIIRAGTIVTGFNTSRGRTTPHMLVWDEPEIGMSEELQHASIDHIVAQTNEWPGQLEGIVLFTHSRIFVDRLTKEAGAGFVNLGGAFGSAEDWLARDVRGRSLPLDKAIDLAHERFREMNAILHAPRK